jgi:glycosyltransferase involved in cell wall biosynthesis
MSTPGVFFSVVYSKALPYLRDVRDSALAQTRKDFDVVLVNDSCDKAQLKEIFSPLDVTILDPDGGFSGNRTQGINYARKQGYKYILFCDADDSFTANRYERTIVEFEKNDADILVCNLNIADEQCRPFFKDYFSKEIEEERWIDADFLKDKNIFGMSNTAIRLDALTEDIQIPETPIVDWLLFTTLLFKGLKARYITDSMVNYRQYSSNMIGINSFDVASFRRLVGLKLNHYRLLTETGYKQFEPLRQESESLQNLSDDEIETIVKRELAIHQQPLWWQIIKK